MSRVGKGVFAAVRILNESCTCYNYTKEEAMATQEQAAAHTQCCYRLYDICKCVSFGGMDGGLPVFY